VWPLPEVTDSLLGLSTDNYKAVIHSDAPGRQNLNVKRRIA